VLEANARRCEAVDGRLDVLDREVEHREGGGLVVLLRVDEDGAVTAEM
jgi:hypothetical protein